MRVTIAAVGAAKNSAFAPIIDDYAHRIARAGPAIGVNQIDIKEVEAPRALKDGARQKAEAQLLQAAIGADAYVVALDERGKPIASEPFARLISKTRDDAVKRLVFVIGGADGLDQSLLRTASTKIAFGSMTWPHLFARAMLAEQIYRAVTILSGHPYHRA